MLGAIIAKPSVGVMIPIPQYPLYTATITLCNGVAVGYYLVGSSRLKQTYKNSFPARGPFPTPHSLGLLSIATTGRECQLGFEAG